LDDFTDAFSDQFGRNCHFQTDTNCGYRQCTWWNRPLWL